MTFLQIKDALAAMWGHEQSSLLPAQDLADIEGFANDALNECYSPVEPFKKRGEWAKRYFGELLKAPMPVSLALTEGSTQFAPTGGTLEAKYAGSYIEIGNHLYRYAGKDGSSNDHLLQPWPLADGDYAATVYYNAVALPADCIGFDETPTAIGIGMLYPVPGQAAEIRFRTEGSYDFMPDRLRSGYKFPRRRFRSSDDHDMGEPYYYHVDSSSVSIVPSSLRRMHVYPIPDVQVSIDGLISIMPPKMTGDADVPRLPGDGSTYDMAQVILLPLAREYLVLNSKGRRFEGDARLISQAADRARSRLKDLARPQQQAGTVITRAPGW